ncbi:MAG: protein-disulfide reductase DsbD family protein, partial [Acidobacteria bacterium]|nr:protein-disulfide reductase DsbD family protein [Acidobacteriota bacterium]
MLRSSQKPRVRAGLLMLAMALLLPLTPRAQEEDLPAPEDVVAVSAFVSLSGVHAGGQGMLAVVGDILAGWHINAHIPSQEFLIPTTLAMVEQDGLVFLDPLYAEGHMVNFEFAEAPLRVYEGRLVTGLPFRVEPGTRPGPMALSGTLTYQACNDHICLPPADVPFEVAVMVATPGEAVAPLNPELFAPLAAQAPAAGNGAAMAIPGEDGVAGASLPVFGLIYLGGLALNL